MTETLLQVRNLRVAFGEHEVLRGLSFELAAGEILALVGQSGSGKSTAVKAILRLLDEPNISTSGEVLYKGLDLLDPSADLIRSLRWVDLSIVMQSALNALNPILSIGAHFVDTFAQHGIQDRSEAWAQAEILLQKVRLEPSLLHAHPHELSGGMRQRVCIALALALEPELVILDECTTALDVLVEREVLDALVGLQEEMGFAVLAISHDLPLLAEFAHRIGILADGKLVECRSMKDFLAGPRHPESDRLLAELPRTTGPRQRDLLPRVPAQSPEPLLEVRGLSKNFGAQVAVSDVSFDLGRGEVLALVGASGSGKSTIARLLARLIPGDSGTIKLGMESLKATHTRCSKAYRQTLQMVFQDPFASLNPAHTVAEHLFRAIGRGPMTKNSPKERAIELLEQVELHPAEDFLPCFPHTLSGGQRQRVAIARCLALQPQLLICDEPTSMLDLPLRMALLRTLNRLREQTEMGILFISHDLAATRYFADRVLVLEGGRVIETGPTEQVLQNPTHPSTQRLLSAAHRKIHVQ
jgi:ABC-type glutathione transport system ATPase component